MSPQSTENHGEESPVEHDVETSTPNGHRYTSRRWTFGDSLRLVEGRGQEPVAVTIAWIVVPTGLALFILAAMAM